MPDAERGVSAAAPGDQRHLPVDVHVLGPAGADREPQRVSLFFRFFFQMKNCGKLIFVGSGTKMDKSRFWKSRSA